jgi:xanthine dehydrogenase YagR molybdenum-binding subunit
MTTTITRTATLVGTALDRVDGRLKVTGQAQYAADMPVDHAAYAVVVSSTIARGRILSIETTAARAVPGVLRIFTHENATRFTQPAIDWMSGIVPAQTFIPLQGPEIIHYGQQVAVVVAETLEAARAAAALVEIAYDARPPVVSLDDPQAQRWLPEEFFGEPMQYERGDVEAALRDAAATIDATYRTPTESHSPLEPHTAIARWDGNKLIVYEPSQWMIGSRNYLAAIFQLKPEDVRVISPFVGGGFGSKGFSHAHTVVAAMCARELGRPVKLMLSRAQVFLLTGHRPETVQRLRLGATKEGRFTAIEHSATVADSYAGWFIEPPALTTSFLYSSPSVRIRHEAVKLNMPAPGPMRAPGEAPGLFALESAIDELAAKLGIDPVEFRIVNDAQVDERDNLPFSSRHLVECLQLGAERFNWRNRPKEPRRMREGDELIGWGVATATYGGLRTPASARATAGSDGHVIVEVATHDLGTGMYTIMTQVAADALGIPIERIECRLGDSDFPRAPVAGGSQSTASVTPAVQQACEELRRRAIELAGEPVDYARAARLSGGTLSIMSDVAPGDEQRRYAFQSFGAQFIEVRVDEALGRVRVTRALGVFDCGRILNPKTARSQMLGGIVFGIGQALLEEGIVDKRTGRLLTDNLAEYRVPVNADIGEIEVLFIEEPDYALNPLGARGIGEIGITGVAAAIANAVYHATGKRIRELPITPEKLL